MLDLHRGNGLKLYPPGHSESRALADPDDPADAAARLEQALERIAASAARAPQTPPSPVPVPLEPPFDTEAVTARLDRLIGRIRAVLDPKSEG
jgi:hypothetical protein